MLEVIGNLRMSPYDPKSQPSHQAAPSSPEPLCHADRDTCLRSMSYERKFGGSI